MRQKYKRLSCNVISFSQGLTCRFFANCTHLLTRTQETFEDVFLVKIPTTLRLSLHDLFKGIFIIYAGGSYQREMFSS